jgi:FkbM family methyltransferase
MKLTSNTWTSSALSAAGRRQSPPIHFGDGSFVLTTEAARDDYFDQLGPDSLPAAVHVAAAVCGAGSVLFDVGANLGLCALPFSTIATETGQVVAVEPGPRAAADLRAAVQLNHRANIEVIEAALGDAKSEATLLDPGWNASGAFISETSRHQRYVLLKRYLRAAPSASPAAAFHELKGDVVAVNVRVMTLDDIVEQRRSERVDLVKIDVEGFEPRVLAGSTRTLERFRPVCVIEFNPLTLSVMASENPLRFLDDLRRTFPFVAAVDGHLNVEAVVDDGASYSLVQRCYLRGQVCDLICAWDDHSDLFGGPRELFGPLAEPDRPQQGIGPPNSAAFPDVDTTQQP